MAVGYNPRTVTDGLVLSLDAGSSKNYNVGISTNWVDKFGGNNGTLVNGTYHNDGPFVGAGYVEFVGTGDAVSAPAGSDFAYGTGDFTIEGWFYPTVIGQVSGAGYPSHILFGQTVAATNYLLFGIDANGKLFYYRTSAGGGSDQFSSAPNGSVVLNKWQYIALCRNNGTTKAFVDGQEIISISDTFNFNNTDRNPTIGNYTHNLTTQPFNGYISNFRILKGTGLYTSNFTPPTKPLTAVTNTVLLTCQGNSISDASSSGHTLTTSGDATANLGFPASAFNFDGTDDYITLPTNFFSFPSQTTFTISLWFKSSQTTGGTLFGQTNNSNPITASGYVPVIYLKTDGSIRIEPFWTGNTGNSIESSSGLNDNNWHNIITTFNSGTNQLYIDGSYVSQRTGLNLVSFTSTYYYFIGVGREGTRNLGTDVFSGNISNFSFYNKALSGAEVEQNYNALRGRYGI